MDKEIEKIDCKLWKNDYYQGLGDDRMFDYRDKVILRYGKLIGCRKPKEKPPLLSDEQMLAEIWDLGFGLEGMEGRAPTQKERFDRIAQAQREADIKFYSEPYESAEKPRFSAGFVDE